MSSPSSVSDVVSRLALFDEKASELLASSFFDDAGGGGALVEFRRGVGWDQVSVGPEEEPTKALVLTLRMFVRDTDGISVGAIAALCADLVVSQDLRDRVEKSRAHLNAFLDSESRLAIEDARQLTFREILDIFLWGDYAHVAPEQRKVFSDLRTTPFFPLFQNCFVEAVVEIARCVSSMREVTTLIVAELAPNERYVMPTPPG